MQISCCYSNTKDPEKNSNRLHIGLVFEGNIIWASDQAVLLLTQLRKYLSTLQPDEGTLPLSVVTAHHFLLTICSKVIVEKLIVIQLVKKFSAFHSSVDKSLPPVSIVSQKNPKMCKGQSVNWLYQG
jgi:hypothetical protein